MALFVDGPVATVDTLTEHDANILSVSAAEGINLTTKLVLAHESIHVQLERLLGRGEFHSDVCGWSAARGIGNVVWSKALRRWHVYETLAMVYRDAYYSQLNDRHQARAKEYEALANGCRRELVQAGLGLVSSPLRRPQEPIVTLLPSADIGGTFYFCVSYTSDLVQESDGSAVVSVTVTDGNAADVTLSRPTAPNATGWNLYAGTAPDQLFRQNEQPIPLDSDWCYLPSIAATGGPKKPMEQEPDQRWSPNRFLQRG